jgi:ParB family transcriptional regulator, chromosome partitioning protein
MTQLYCKPLLWFQPDPAQPRKAFDEGELRLLGESLAKKQLVPVIARPDGVLIDGERRWRAATIAGLATLDAVISDEPLTSAQILEIQLISALHRADLTPYELYAGCKQWLASHPGSTARELAERIDRDAGHLSKLLSLSRCVQAVQEAAAAGHLSVSDWYAISKVAGELQGELLEQKLRGATRDALEAQVRSKRSGGTPQVRLTRIKCPLPSNGATVVVSGEAMTLADLVEALAELLKHARKAASEGLDASTFERVLADKARV